MELLSGDAIKVGLLVRHASQESWGLGKIVHADSGYVWVYFNDIEGSAKIAVKQLSAAQPRLVRAETQTDLFLDNLPPMVREGRVVPPDAKRLTERQAIQAFVNEYRSFSDPIYVEKERDYKWKAHLQTTDELMSPAGRELVAKGPSEQLSKTLNRLVHLTNLLAVQEFAGLNDAFRNDKAACA
jgi:hypothetical protein